MFRTRKRKEGVIGIVRVRREQSLFGEEIHVYFNLNGKSLRVVLGADDFSEANLERLYKKLAKM